MKYKLIFFLFDHFVDMVTRYLGQLTVLSGPFKGMNYIRGSVGSSFMPKIFGTYELEIAPWISELPQFGLGLDIGAAEGYYAVGLLRSKICKRMIAWEMNPNGQVMMSQLAVANSVDSRLDIRGYCDSTQLNQSISEASGNVLVVIDCEGFEGDLLEPVDGNLLSRCSFIIETHNSIKPGVHEQLIKKLGATHDIKENFPKRRNADDIPAIISGFIKVFQMPILRRLAMSERRCQGLGWLL
jgi:hypothetical protein